MNEQNFSELNIYENRKKRKKYLIAALLLIFLLGLGYAYLQTQLTISGTASVKENNWSVYWRNLHVTDGSIEIDPQDESSSAAEIGPNTLVSFTVNLEKPGDYYEFTIEAYNAGSLDAMIGSIEKKVNGLADNIPSYLNYTVEYADGIPLYQKQLLGSEKAETYRVRVEFKKDITSDDLIDDPVQLSCTFAVNYVQADNNAKTVRLYAGVSDENKVFTIGQTIPSGVDVFETEADATQTYPVLVKYALDDDGKVAAAYVGAKNGSNYYYFPNDSYEKQIDLVSSIYTPDSCAEHSIATNMTFLAPIENHSYTYCIKGSREWETTLDSMRIIVFVANNGYGCCLYHNQFTCQDVPSLYQFVGYSQS